MSDEGFDRIRVLKEELRNRRRARVPDVEPQHLRRRAAKHAQLHEVLILGHDHALLGSSDLRQPNIRCTAQTDERRIALSRPAGRFRISPRGDRIAIADGLRLSVMNLDGSDPLQLAVNASNAAWSPDGMRLAYVRIPGRELRIMESYGGADVVVPGALPGGYYALAWSPGGGRIAFEGMRDGSRTIFVVNVDGTGLRDIDLSLPGPERRSSGEPTWSPNGRELAFSRFTRPDGVTVQNSLWVATLATGQARQITSPGGSSDVRPSWSPEGDRIAFLRFDGDRSEVYVVRFDGTGLRRITRTPTIREEDPQWMRRR